MEYLIVPEYYVKRVGINYPDFRPCPQEVANPRCTKEDLINENPPDFSYDFSLPQHYVDHYLRTLGVYLPRHFIWNVTANCLHPITIAGRAIYDVIQHIEGNQNEGGRK